MGSSTFSFLCFKFLKESAERNLSIIPINNFIYRNIYRNVDCGICNKLFVFLGQNNCSEFSILIEQLRDQLGYLSKP